MVIRIQLHERIVCDNPFCALCKGCLQIHRTVCEQQLFVIVTDVVANDIDISWRNITFVFTIITSKHHDHSVCVFRITDASKFSFIEVAVHFDPLVDFFLLQLIRNLHSLLLQLKRNKQ